MDPNGRDPVQSRILANPISYDYLQRSGLADGASVGYLSEHGLLREAVASNGGQFQGMQQSEKNLLAVEQGALEVFPVLVGVGMSAASSNGGTGAPQAAEGAGGKGLANPFKGKSAGEIDKMFKKKGFDPRGPDPKGGKGGYVDPKTGRSYHIDEANSFGEPPHVDVNRPKDYPGPLDKKKLDM